MPTDEKNLESDAALLKLWKEMEPASNVDFRGIAKAVFSPSCVPPDEDEKLPSTFSLLESTLKALEENVVDARDREGEIGLARLYLVAGETEIADREMLQLEVTEEMRETVRRGKERLAALE